MKKYILRLICLLVLSGINISTYAQDKYAFLTSWQRVEDIQDDDERAAAQWFMSYFPEAKRDLLTINSIQNKEIDLQQYKVIWIHIDRENEYAEIPQEYREPEVLSTISNYYKNGGNIFLSIHACKYLSLLGRIPEERNPNIVSDGSPSFNSDVWGLNPHIGMAYNYFSHPLYQNTQTLNGIFSHPIIPLIGSGDKEDHNCMWDLNAFGYTGNVVDSFEKENQALVLGTWGHVEDYCCAGIVEFLSTDTYKGRCIAVGMGGYEWNQNSGTNVWHHNIERITHNIFNYLSTDIPSFEEPSLVAWYPMELNSSATSIREMITDRSFNVEDAKSVRENVPGAVGNALRFDGYSTCVSTLFNSSSLNDRALTFSLWCALEFYPMMHVDGISEEQTFIAGNMKEEQKAGFAFTVNAHGRYGFEVYVDGQKISCYANEKFPRYEWVQLSATVNLNQGLITLYKNNEAIARSVIIGNRINTGGNSFIIGRSFNELYQGVNRLNTIPGLIDEIQIYSGEVKPVDVPFVPENPADLTIPQTRFQEDIHRPHFHSMPAANWANEPHGLIWYEGKYHLFFQKNGLGPYWGRINWGHLVSENLFDWKEEKPVVEPTDPYDCKGNWSGCVFMDEELTNGRPHIYYTAVDLGRASIVQAIPVDEGLITWQKPSYNPVIPHRPDGLDEDFRDPYVFKANNTYYMMVGGRKDGRGIATLHQYDFHTRQWSNDGRLFYQATDNVYGEFWEMPVVVPMADNKWLFVVTPLGGANGVQTLYWVGNLNGDGTFTPFSHIPQKVELGNMAKEGFGLLSPSVLQKDGKTIAIGIVPDKLGEHDSRTLGWAHTFSLPREWSLDNDNNLVQKPFEGLKQMRTAEHAFSRSGFNLNGTLSLEPIKGKRAELELTFTVSSDAKQSVGFNVRKNGDKAIRIYYQPVMNKLTVDAREVDRIQHDHWLYNGLYQEALPIKYTTGETIKLHVFIDHSIMDIFINDTWAFSIRLFPTDVNGNGIELFSEGADSFINSIQAWAIGVDGFSEVASVEKSKEEVTVYSSGNKLHIENLPQTAQLKVVDMLGRTLINKTTSRDKEEIELPRKQIYIVSVRTDSYSIEKKIMHP